MGHVLLAAPTIERFHLHEQIGRRLMRRGHRVTLLATDPVTFRCYSVHGLPTRLLRPARTRDPAGLHLHDLAVRDATLEGRLDPDIVRVRRLRARLEHRTTPLMRLFETEMPDVVVFVQGRTGLHGLIDAVARSFGCAVTHLGDGLLPGTLQRDPEGIDGDASASRRAAGYYRSVRADRPLCDAALVALLGEVDAPPVARRFVHPPDIIDTIACLGAARSTASWRWAWERLRAWRAESARPFPRRRAEIDGLPAAPFVALLLQSPRDPRVLLDADGQAPSPTELAHAVRCASQALDPVLEVVAVRAPGLPEETIDALRAEGFTLRSPRTAALAAATATAVVTINHPLAMGGVLAGTPVLHLGRALYAVRGVATQTSLSRIRDDLAMGAAAVSQATLRARFATRMLEADHIWCSPEAPDPNGLRGLLTHVEDVLRRATPPPEPTPYRPGPGWPLVRPS